MSLIPETPVPARNRPAPTLDTVAAEAGVSRQTVSNALNSPHLLRADTLARVQEAIDRLGYSPNRAARNLRTRASHLIGLRIEPGLPLLLLGGAAQLPEAQRCRHRQGRHRGHGEEQPAQAQSRGALRGVHRALPGRPMPTRPAGVLPSDILVSCICELRIMLHLP